jgi:hypothetical protein
MAATGRVAPTAVRRGAREKEAGGVSRPEVKRVAQRGKNRFFLFIFLNNSNIFTFFSSKNPFSQVGPKIKVV